MPNNVFRGDSQAIERVDTVTLGSVANGVIYSVTRNRKTVSYTATGSDTNITAAAALQALLESSTLKEFIEITWSIPASSAVITATATTAGVYYDFSVSVSGGGTIVKASVTSSAGPNHLDDPNNWSQSRIPAGECSTPVQAAAVAASGGTLTDTTQYYWVVTAYNANGETVKSNQQTLTIAAPNQTATISWAAVIGADGYKVYRSTTTNTYTTPALVATVVGGSVLTYLDTGTAVGTGSPLGVSTAIGDDVYLPFSSVSLLYGIDQSYKVWNSLHVDAAYTGQGGLPDVNDSGYYEDRDTYIKASPKTVYFGENEGSAPSLFRLDTGTNQCTWIVNRTGHTRTQGQSALYIKGSHVSNALVAQQGDIGAAIEAGTTARFATIETGYMDSPPTDVNLILGSGVTVGTSIVQLGGIIHAHCNIPALDTTSGSQGEFYLHGAATMGTLTMHGGTYYPLGTGTHTSVLLNFGGKFDKRQNVQAMTITDITLRDGCTFLDPAHSITYTNDPVVDGNLNSMTTDFGSGYTLRFIS